MNWAKLYYCTQIKNELGKIVLLHSNNYHVNFVYTCLGSFDGLVVGNVVSYERDPLAPAIRAHFAMRLVGEGHGLIDPGVNVMISEPV
jgi:hypothetical protein